MGTIGIPWDYHGNGSDNDFIIGMGTIGVHAITTGMGVTMTIS